MKIIYFGLNEFGEICLEKLLRHKINISKVVIADDQKTKEIFSICNKHKIPILNYDSKDSPLLRQIVNYRPDLIIIASFSKLIPKDIFRSPKFGTMNIHPSGLPQYRGAHPIQWAIIKDEKNLGVTIHYVDEGMDTGAIIAQKYIPLENKDNIYSMTKKLATVGSRLLISVVKEIEKNKKSSLGISQRASAVSFAPKRKPEDGKIDWRNNSREIFNLIRALKKDYPAFTHTVEGTKVKIEQVFLSNTSGKVLAKIGKHYLVSTGDGVVLIHTQSQLEIGQVLS